MYWNNVLVLHLIDLLLIFYQWTTNPGNMICQGYINLHFADGGLTGILGYDLG